MQILSFKCYLDISNTMIFLIKSNRTLHEFERGPAAGGDVAELVLGAPLGRAGRRVAAPDHHHAALGRLGHCRVHQSLEVEIVH